jgi:hypothetical protein
MQAYAREGQATQASPLNDMATMNVFIAIPTVLSFLVLAAHFYRAGNSILAGACVIAPFVLLIFRREWAVRVVQAMLLLGALEWVATLVRLIDERAREGRPWMRMAAILGAVALFSFGSMILLLWFRVRPRRRSMPPPPMTHDDLRAEGR